MLKKYRHKFIALNMITVGLVLIITFSYIGFELYRNNYSELKNVMSLVVKPWNTSHSDDHTYDRDNQPPEKPDQKNNGQNTQQAQPDNADNAHPPEPKNSQKSRGKTEGTLYKNDDIYTYFYNSEKNTVIVLSEFNGYNGDLKELMKKVSEQKENFGFLDEYRIIYYRERTENNAFKVAVTDKWYIESIVLRISLILFAAFLITMGLVYLISMRLARIAARPMEKAFEMERQFVRDISHDLKTPVTVILANNSILRSNPQTSISDNMQWIQSTDTAAKNMMNMVSEMLTLSQLESTDIRVERETVPLSQTAEKTVLQLESVAYENGIELKTEIEKDLDILAVSDHVKRICSGLIENALKYEPSGGCVTVKVCAAKKNTVFSVHNRKSYIPSQELVHVFESFYRGDKTRASKMGHGLGLPIIKRMTELSGAELNVKSSENERTLFSVFFESA